MVDSPAGCSGAGAVVDSPAGCSGAGATAGASVVVAGTTGATGAAGVVAGVMVDFFLALNSLSIRTLRIKQRIMNREPKKIVPFLSTSVVRAPKAWSVIWAPKAAPRPSCLGRCMSTSNRSRAHTIMSRAKTMYLKVTKSMAWIVSNKMWVVKTYAIISLSSLQTMRRGVIGLSSIAKLIMTTRSPALIR